MIYRIATAGRFQQSQIPSWHWTLCTHMVSGQVHRIFWCHVDFESLFSLLYLSIGTLCTWYQVKFSGYSSFDLKLMPFSQFFFWKPFVGCCIQNKEAMTLTITICWAWMGWRAPGGKQRFKIAGIGCTLWLMSPGPIRVNPKHLVLNPPLQVATWVLPLSNSFPRLTNSSPPFPNKLVKSWGWIQHKNTCSALTVKIVVLSNICPSVWVNM